VLAPGADGSIQVPPLRAAATRVFDPLENESAIGGFDAGGHYPGRRGADRAAPPPAFEWSVGRPVRLVLRWSSGGATVEHLFMFDKQNSGKL
jgi:hypothetical protein